MAASLSPHSVHTVRQIGHLALQRAAQVAAGVLFVALIPRAMGPDLFGQYVTLQTLSLWFAAAGGLGAVSLMTRYVPEFVARGDTIGLRKLTASLFTLRLGNGVLGAIIYFVAVRLWLGDLDRVAIALVALTVTLRTAANLPFALLLGLNRVSQWGAGELLRRLLVLPLTYAGVRAAGLRGACAALLAVEGAVLVLGLWWSRGHLGRPSLRVDRPFLAPFLRFSALFFLGNLLIRLFEQGGAPLVRLTLGDYAQAGYYGVAFGAYLAGAHAAWKLLSAFGPLFSTLRVAGDLAGVSAWIARLLRILAIGGVVVSALLFACSDLLVGWILGRGYEPVAALLPWLAVAGLAAGPGNVARVLAVSFSQGRVSIGAAMAQLLCFATVGWILIPRIGVTGGGIAAMAATAFFSAYGTWRIREAVAYSLRPWTGVVALGAVCSPVLWAWSAAGPVRFASFLAIYGAAAFAVGILRASEIRLLWRVLRAGQPAAIE